MSKWLENAVFYEIYPQSFYDTNEDGIGDINGIAEKLAYIKSLGCNSIWINPCFESPFNDAGYDISDYYTIAERYGTNEDMKHLCEKAHEMDMHILLDLVPCHTSVEHPWFIESMKAEKNEYSDRYIWTDTVWNELRDYNTIRGISDRDGTCVVSYFSSQPALNYGFYEIDDPKWQQPPSAEGPTKTFEEMLNIMRFWLDIGCDGFRVDMAACLVRNDPNRVGTIKVWQKATSTIKKEYPNCALIAEWGEPENSLKSGFDMDFFLHFGTTHYMDLFRTDNPYFAGCGDASRFIKNYKKLLKDTKGKGLMCMPSGNHDMVRMSDFLNTEQQKIAFAFILTLPGAPFIYYGDEIGMKYQNLPSKEGGYFRTGARTPMQWDSTENAGFSKGASENLYLPIDSDDNRSTVEKAISNKNSLLNTIKALIDLRQNNKALQSYGKIEFIKEGYPLIYRRKYEDQEITVIINAKDQPVTVKAKGSILLTIGGNTKLEKGKCTLDGTTAVILNARL